MMLCHELKPATCKQQAALWWAPRRRLDCCPWLVRGLELWEATQGSLRGAPLRLMARIRTRSGGVGRARPLQGTARFAAASCLRAPAGGNAPLAPKAYVVWGGAAAAWIALHGGVHVLMQPCGEHQGRGSACCPPLPGWDGGPAV
jgi:hypothetical protein